MQMNLLNKILKVKKNKSRKVQAIQQTLTS